jgi:tetratricopeptide (TPR) repeat protein
MRVSDPIRRDQLLDRAVQTPDCLSELMALSQASLPGAAGRALRAAELAVLVADRRAEWREAAVAWRLRARALRVVGRHAEAVEAFVAAAERAERSGDSLLAAQVQVGCVDSLGWMGRYEEALTLAGRLEAQLLAGGADRHAANVLINLGGLHFRRRPIKLHT